MRYAALVLAATVVALVPGAPARAAADVFLEINPETVQAGYLVGLRASCTDNTKPATVTSDAFSDVTVQPQSGFLTAVVTVPAGTDAQRYDVELDCPTGPSATARLNVLAGSEPSRGPATGFGGMAGDGGGPLLLGGGLAALAAAAVLGVVTLRRRRA
ncbi:hypothetical protein WEI85_21150 [Actinomycetes bacterium KLBMP 9797]